MSSHGPKTTVRKEAVVWFAALRLRGVTNDQRREFFWWRDDPSNNEAFEELEREARYGPRTVH